MVTALALLFLGSALLTFAAANRTEFGTAEEQEKVRISRDVSTLPLRTTCPVDPQRELFITHLSVVNDCYRTTWEGPCPAPYPPATRAAWTFGRLAEGIFGTTDPVVLSYLTRRWLKQWTVAQTVNGDMVPARPSIDDLVIAPWEKASGGTGFLDMKKAPFRLLAIVSRLDLRQNAGYSGGGATAGEGRFVFNLLDADGGTTEFLLILEYGLDAEDCLGIQEWAEAWHGLGAIPFGPAYNAALQEVTDRFTAIGASPNKPNGSAINQVRTNEIALAGPWELREFRLRSPVDLSGPAPLLQFTVAQTPDNDHQQTSLLADYANTNATAILANRHVVPLSWGDPPEPFRGGASRHTLEFGWDGPPPACTSIKNGVRHNLSLNTCNGCHGGETDTVFKHVEPRPPNQPSQLSQFLTGNQLSIDMCNGIHSFGDIERRRVDLCQLLDKSCSQIDSEPAITFVH